MFDHTCVYVCVDICLYIVCLLACECLICLFHQLSANRVLPTMYKGEVYVNISLLLLPFFNQSVTF